MVNLWIYIFKWAVHSHDVKFDSRIKLRSSLALCKDIFHDVLGDARNFSDQTKSEILQLLNFLKDCDVLSRNELILILGSTWDSCGDIKAYNHKLCEPELSSFRNIRLRLAEQLIDHAFGDRIDLAIFKKILHCLRFCYLRLLRVLWLIHLSLLCFHIN